MSTWLDFAVITIFARETLEGGIIIGQYRTVILRSDWQNADCTKAEALRAITVAALAAAACMRGSFSLALWTRQPRAWHRRICRFCWISVTLIRLPSD